MTPHLSRGQGSAHQAVPHSDFLGLFEAISELFQGYSWNVKEVKRVCPSRPGVRLSFCSEFFCLERVPRTYLRRPQALSGRPIRSTMSSAHPLRQSLIFASRPNAPPASRHSCRCASLKPPPAGCHRRCVDAGRRKDVLQRPVHPPVVRLAIIRRGHVSVVTRCVTT